MQSFGGVVLGREFSRLFPSMIHGAATGWYVVKHDEEREYEPVFEDIG